MFRPGQQGQHGQHEQHIQQGQQRQQGQQGHQGQQVHQGQHHQQTDAFYDSFATTPFAATAVGAYQQHGQPITGNHHHHNQAGGNTYNHHQLNDGGATAWATGLPDDDDPLLQRRLQQLVEQHKPSASSRNVLRELADVAEQQSTPSGNSHNNKRRGAYDDELDSDDDDGDSTRNKYSNSNSRSISAMMNKKRKSSTNSSTYNSTPNMMQGTSGARKQMDDVIAKRNNLRFSIKTMQIQIEHMQRQVDKEQTQLTAMEKLVNDTSAAFMDELLDDATTWNQLYFALVDFYHLHNHLRVPWRKEDKEKDPVMARLGPWLVQQRKDYRRDEDDPERLEPYKIRALEKLQIEWEPFRQHWFNRFDELKRYKEQHGDCRVPYCSGRSQKRKKKTATGEKPADVVEDVTPVNADAIIADQDDGGDGSNNSKIKYDSLGVWVKRQRNQYKNYKVGNKEKAGEMTEERVKLLESVGFEWSLRAVGTESISWVDNYNSLKAFKEEHGHTLIDDKQNKALGDWIKLMRNYMKKYSEGSEDNALSSEHYQLLKDLELDSSLRESKFEARFRELMEFKKAHGHCLVPASYAANQKLSNWVQTQKRQYKLMKGGKKLSSQMTEDKCQMLMEAGFEFEVSKERKSKAMKQMDRSWDELFAELKQYKAKYGQINSIKQRKKMALREWCDEQRVQHARMKWGKESTITEEQVHKLSELGFVWTAADTPSKGWDDYYGDLLSSFIKNQCFDIPDEDDELKQWVETQKVEYKKYISGVPSLITKPRIKKLSDVSFPWRGDQEKHEARLATKNSWEEMFGQLLVFKIHNMHFSVPKSMKDLRKWACQQRLDKSNHDNSKFSTKRSAIWEERIHRLSEVGFDWLGDLPGKQDTLKKAPTRLPIMNSIQGAAQRSAAALNAVTMMSPLRAAQTKLVFSPTTNWTAVAAASPAMPNFMANAAAGQLFLSAAQATSNNGMLAAGRKDLASQAAQIVAATNNRSQTIDNPVTKQAVRISAAGGPLLPSPPVPIVPAPLNVAATTTNGDDDISQEHACTI